MSLNHALVVDDSRSARVALKRLLEEHDLRVSVAGSGEEALDFLQRASSTAQDRVDVVFMDHTMPGMDGLEAVAAIKANPDTATIPVMMYTTREGEVYVGQARALGAVGVMPKNVQPHQLFEMLASLGLVKDRRSKQVEQVDEIDLALDQQAMGINVQNLLQRMLEDQQMTLRSDILRSQRSFAKQVAKEIVLEQARAEEAIGVERPQQSRITNYFSGLAIVLLAVATFLAWQFKSERDIALQAMAASDTSANVRLNTELADLQSAVELTESSLDRVRAQALQSLQWAANRDTTTSWDANSFSPALAASTEQLLSQLEGLGFRGTVSMQSHLGRFCLLEDGLGDYRVASPELPVSECDFIGHPQELSSRVTDRLSVPFARLFQEYDDGPISLSLAALSGDESVEVEPYPSGGTAGEWNQIARQNNRIVITLSSE